LRGLSAAAVVVTVAVADDVVVVGGRSISTEKFWGRAPRSMAEANSLSTDQAASSAGSSQTQFLNLERDNPLID
jgi:hypothetical protein